MSSSQVVFGTVFGKVIGKSSGELVLRGSFGTHVGSSVVLSLTVTTMSILAGVGRWQSLLSRCNPVIDEFSAVSSTRNISWK